MSSSLYLRVLLQRNPLIVITMISRLCKSDIKLFIKAYHMKICAKCYYWLNWSKHLRDTTRYVIHGSSMFTLSVDNPPGQKQKQRYFTVFGLILLLKVTFLVILISVVCLGSSSGKSRMRRGFVTELKQHSRSRSSILEPDLSSLFSDVLGTSLWPWHWKKYRFTPLFVVNIFYQTEPWIF